MPRLFFGIPLSEHVRREVDRALTGLSPGRLPARITPAENWHITLRFLGATAPEARGKLEAAIRRERLPGPFELRLAGWGAFPRVRRARVLWLGIEEPAGALARLAAAMEQAARAADFEPETRPFHPHVTLGRFRNPLDLGSLLRDLPALDHMLPVTSFTLFRSHLGAGPPQYEAEAVFPL